MGRLRLESWGALRDFYRYYDKKASHRNPPKPPRFAELFIDLFRRFSVASVTFGGRMLFCKKLVMHPNHAVKCPQAGVRRMRYSSCLATLATRRVASCIPAIAIQPNSSPSIAPMMNCIVCEDTPIASRRNTSFMTWVSYQENRLNDYFNTSVATASVQRFKSDRPTARGRGLWKKALLSLIIFSIYATMRRKNLLVFQLIEPPWIFGPL